jgi:hypothetical protein
LLDDARVGWGGAGLPPAWPLWLTITCSRVPATCLPAAGSHLPLCGGRCAHRLCLRLHAPLPVEGEGGSCGEGLVGASKGREMLHAAPTPALPSPSLQLRRWQAFEHHAREHELRPLRSRFLPRPGDNAVAHALRCAAFMAAGGGGQALRRQGLPARVPSTACVALCDCGVAALSGCLLAIQSHCVGPRAFFPMQTA